MNWVNILQQQNSGTNVFSSKDLEKMIPKEKGFYDLSDMSRMEYETINDTDITQEIALKTDPEYNKYKVYPKDHVFVLDPGFFATGAESSSTYAFNPPGMNVFFKDQLNNIPNIPNAIAMCKEIRSGKYNVFGFDRRGKRMTDWDTKKHQVFIDPFLIAQLFKYRGILYSQNGKYLDPSEGLTDEQMQDKKRFRFGDDDNLPTLEAVILEGSDIEVRNCISNRELKEGLMVDAFFEQRVSLEKYQDGTTPKDDLRVQMSIEGTDIHLMAFDEAFGFYPDPRPGIPLCSIGSYQMPYKEVPFNDRYGKEGYGVRMDVLEDYSKLDRSGTNEKATFVNYIRYSPIIRVNL